MPIVDLSQGLAGSSGAGVESLLAVRGAAGGGLIELRALRWVAFFERTFLLGQGWPTGAFGRSVHGPDLRTVPAPQEM